MESIRRVGLALQDSQRARLKWSRNDPCKLALVVTKKCQDAHLGGVEREIKSIRSIFTATHFIAHEFRV